VVAKVIDRASWLRSHTRPLAALRLSTICPSTIGPIYTVLSYSACAAARLWRTASLAAFGGVLAVTAGGCSFSYQLDNLFSKKDDPALTGSLQLARPIDKPVDIVPPEADLAMARAAAAEIMSKGGKDASLSWENPQTGTRGTVTPIASARNEDGGITCHEFLASFEREGTSSWMQGDACRAKGKWEVRSLRPWQQRT
jgi:17 kDa outer membrane surface antigen